MDIRKPAAQWTDTDIEAMYTKLLATAKEKRTSKAPTKWNPSEFQTVSGYAVRVAENSSLDEFKQFIHTGEPVHPVKMTPAEMELLQGGSRATDWIIAVGSVATAAGAACCA
ncbi:MAG TPA: hypothetical protein VGF94_02015 [Kofleriaceae bacterium]|jgi:hypothetical protein